MKYCLREEKKTTLWRCVLCNLGYILALLLILFLMDIAYAFYNPHYTYVRFTGHERTLISFLLVLSLNRSRGVRVFFLVIIFLSSLIQFLHFQYFGNLVQPIEFYQFLFNLQEVTESYMYAIATAFVPLGLVSVTFFVAIFVNNWFQGKMVFFRFGMILLVLFFSYQIAWSYSYLRHNSGRITHHYMKKIYPRPTALSVTNFQRSFFCFISGVVPQKFFGSKQNYPVLDPPDLEEILPKRTVVLVIGESLRFDRLSLLGYDKPTTPQLDQLYADKEIYADWIYAGGTVTKTAVSVVLNRLKYPGDSALTSRQKNSLFKLAKDNGFTTYFFSAQKKSKMSFLDSLICKKCIDHYKNRTDYKNEHAGASRYDDILLSITEEIDWSKSSFVVLQQRGSHSPYAKQVPSKYKKFENDYDNTVLYTDYILASLLRKIRGKCKNDLYFMFVSDHGELLGESGKNGHGWFEKEVYKIPFIFYADRKNREILPKIRSQFDVSNLVATALGYRVQWDPPDEDLYINGPDLNALGGYLHLKMAGKKILKKELVR